MDVRSERSPRRDADTKEKTVLGHEQKAWFREQLDEAGRVGQLVVWVNPMPWIGEKTAGADHWGGYDTERQEIASWLREATAPPVVMLAGDAHMLAMDDGSNNTYGGDSPLFRVFHAAALDRHGSIKGGPYSHEPIPGTGHFGLMRFDDLGDRLEITFSGRDLDDKELLSMQWTINLPRKKPPITR